MANTSSKKTKKTPKKTTAQQSTVSDSKRSLTQKLKDVRTQRATRKAEDKKRQQTKKARQEKAKHEAIREHAVEQVNEAVLQSKRRKSRPLMTLLLVLMIAGLGGAAVYQYRQQEIDEKQVTIVGLQSDIADFQELRAAIEAERQQEEANFTILPLDTNTTIRVPRDWTYKNSQLPQQEQVIGNQNVTMRIISSESRNSIDQFIPKIDYIWTLDGTDTIRVTAKSLHCERFDRISNDLNNDIREHRGFTVYCDDTSERVVIAAVATPQAYGILPSNTYFIIEVQDLQQLNFSELQSYIESFKQ